MMHWQNLLQDTRAGTRQKTFEPERSAFQKDVDRIIFSSAFRRLQDKTQVFPLAQNDYVRTRLTHSLEVSSVGRSLGTLVGKAIIDRHQLTISAEEIGSITAAACLAHDIGNPPFGHFGESAIRDFFHQREIGQAILAKLPADKAKDLALFEGNAQGFRILTSLQNPGIAGGMQLTYATLGAFMKYPQTVIQIPQQQQTVAQKKNGFFLSEAAIFNQIARSLQIPQYADGGFMRHPLVYLMEAADDICYAIIDIEDAYQARVIDFQTAFDLLYPLANNAKNKRRMRLQQRRKSDQLSELRAKAIGTLINEVVTLFLENETALLAGDYPYALSTQIPLAQPLLALTDFAAEHIYTCQAAVEIELAGYRILGDLLDMFCSMAEDLAVHGKNAGAYSKMLKHLFPERFFAVENFMTDPYARTRSVIDYVSGMTDSYAVRIHQRLMGVQLSS